MAGHWSQFHLYVTATVDAELLFLLPLRFAEGSSPSV